MNDSSAHNPSVQAAVPVFEVPRPRLARNNFLREIVETVLLIVIVYTLVNLASVRFYIEGPSMQPSFAEGQFLIVSRAHYLFGEPHRGDIVVFDRPDDDADPNDPLLIKRLIGEPGDTIELRDQRVYINGILLDEPYIKEPCDTAHCRDNQWIIGANQFFFMGDNRNNSSDSRVFGAVERSRIVGQVIIRYWPPPDWGIVSHYRFPDSQPSN